MGTLEEYDALRETDRARALEGYAALQDQIAADDADRILWIADQVAPTPPASLDRLFARVPEDGDSLLARAAAHARAMIAWFAGRSDAAERGWVEGISQGGVPRDRFWIRACLNLAMALSGRGCLFEPVVLTGMGGRAARAAGLPYLEAYAAFFRASVLLDMNEAERAEHFANQGREAAARIETQGEERVLSYMAFDVMADLCRARGDLEAARRERERQLSWLEAYGHVEGAILAEVHGSLLALRYELEPEARPAVVAAVAKLPETHALGPAWAGDGRRNLLELQTRHAVDRGDPEEARRVARLLLQNLGDEGEASRRLRGAAKLARILSGMDEDEGLAQEAFELASQASLMRVMAADQATRDIPVLADATPEDWEILRDFRAYLRHEQRSLLDSVARVLRPGGPAFDLLVHDNMIRICAWCYRVRTSADTWLPIAHYVPSDSAFAVSHGICDACRGHYFPDYPPRASR